MTNSVVLALVAGHGEFAAGLVSAVAQITGRGDRFLAVSNKGQSAEEVERQLGEALERTGARVIFTDLPAGSSTIAARRLQRERESIVVVTGANLAALLDFVFHDEANPAAAASRAVERGRASISVAGVPGVR
ncbi:MAG: PTS sugar transporter subunit IIA [Gemmatimonadaceae bacterium]